MEALRDRHGKQTYSLPKEGIYDENGFLFHHCTPRAIMDIHRKRLAQHGIILGRKIYSDDDIQKLKRNWEAYRKEHGFSYWSILQLCGKGTSHSERKAKNGERKQVYDFLKETNFWPRLCADIPERTSLGICSAIKMIFDVYRNVNVTDEERPFCEKLYLSTRSYIAVADTMRRSIKHVKACIKAAKDRKMFSLSERRWLWTSIKHAYPALFENGMIPRSDMINWKSLESKLLRNSVVLKQQWTTMSREIESTIKVGHTLEEALDIVAPKCQHVSPLQVAHFINIVKDKVIDAEDRRIGRAETLIAPLMREQGLTGFHSRRLSEFGYLRLLVNRMIHNCRKRILDPCRIVLSLKNLLKLIAEMLRTLPNSDTPRQIKITTKHFFRTMIRMKREHDSSWRPQNKVLRRFIAESLPDLL